MATYVSNIVHVINKTPTRGGGGTDTLVTLSGIGTLQSSPLLFTDIQGTTWLYFTTTTGNLYAAGGFLGVAGAYIDSVGGNVRTFWKSGDTGILPNTTPVLDGGGSLYVCTSSAVFRYPTPPSTTTPVANNTATPNVYQWTQPGTIRTSPIISSQNKLSFVAFDPISKINYIRTLSSDPVFITDYAIPDFTIPNVTYVSGDGQTTPYVVSYNGEIYTANGGSIGGGSAFQHVFLRAVVAIPGAPIYVSGDDYYPDTGNPFGNLSTVVSGVSVFGAWLQITAPSAFILTSYNLLWVNGRSASIPDSWVIAGSTDGGTTFTRVDTQLGQFPTFVDNGLENVSSWSLPLNTRAYTTYRIIVTMTSGGTRTVGIGSWNLFTNIQINN
jgi:hypothetical protein